MTTEQPGEPLSEVTATPPVDDPITDTVASVLTPEPEPQPDELSPTEEPAREAEQPLSFEEITPEERVTLNEILASALDEQQLAQFETELAWSFLETETGAPHLENLQMLIDRWTGEPGQVFAEDVLAAITALQRGS